jgi:hypothetical protein
MDTIQKLVPSGIAILAATLLSLFVRDSVAMILASYLVAMLAPVLALVRCLRPGRPRWRILAATDPTSWKTDELPAVVAVGVVVLAGGVGVEAEAVGGRVA